MRKVGPVLCPLAARVRDERAREHTDDAEVPAEDARGAAESRRAWERSNARTKGEEGCTARDASRTRGAQASGAAHGNAEVRAGKLA
jgi:hypothetical protein